MRLKFCEKEQLKNCKNDYNGCGESLFCFYKKKKKKKKTLSCPPLEVSNGASLIPNQACQSFINYYLCVNQPTNFPCESCGMILAHIWVDLVSLSGRINQ